MSDTPAPSRAPTTALPPELLKMKALIAAVVAAECTCAEQYATDGRPTSRAALRANAANEALDAALLQFVEDGRRYRFLRGNPLALDQINGASVGADTFDRLTDEAMANQQFRAARSVVAAPVGEAEQP